MIILEAKSEQERQEEINKMGPCYKCGTIDVPHMYKKYEGMPFCQCGRLIGAYYKIDDIRHINITIRG